MQQRCRGAFDKRKSEATQYLEVLNQTRKEIDDFVSGIIMQEKMENNTNKTTAHGIASDEQYSRLMDQLRIMLIPTASHSDLLKKAVHREIEDLSMIVQAMIPQKDGTAKRVLVTADALDAMDIDKEKFLQDAISASEKNYPAGMAPLSAVLGNGMGDPVYVASMADMINGAGVILYPNFMEKAAQELGGDFYVLPSSVHEVLFLRDDDAISLEELKGIVHSVNQTEVSDEDFLSDNVYHYDATERKLEIGEKFQERKAHEKEGRHSVLGELTSAKASVKAPVEKAARKAR